MIKILLNRPVVLEPGVASTELTLNWPAVLDPSFEDETAVLLGAVRVCLLMYERARVRAPESIDDVDEER